MNSLKVCLKRKDWSYFNTTKVKHTHTHTHTIINSKSSTDSNGYFGRTGLTLKKDFSPKHWQWTYFFIIGKKQPTHTPQYLKFQFPKKAQSCFIENVPTLSPVMDPQQMSTCSQPPTLRVSFMDTHRDHKLLCLWTQLLISNLRTLVSVLFHLKLLDRNFSLSILNTNSDLKKICYKKWKHRFWKTTKNFDTLLITSPRTL